jgi:transcriptional antiterminator NusG
MGISRLELGNQLNVDDTIKIINGPFAGMFGKIRELDFEHQKVSIDVDLFGQETRIDLDLTEIDRV